MNYRVTTTECGPNHSYYVNESEARADFEATCAQFGNFPYLENCELFQLGSDGEWHSILTADSYLASLRAA